MASGREWFGRWSVRRDAFALAQSGSLGYYHSFRQRLGHQGLFADRLDAHTAARVIEPGVEAWYQSRSRWYAPELGRFVTADPNGTGAPVQASLAMHGLMASGPPSGSFGWESHYGDGWDVFTAYAANPVLGQDPTGLSLLAFAQRTLPGANLRYRAVQANRFAYQIADDLIAEFAYGGVSIGGGAVVGVSLLDELFGIKVSVPAFVREFGNNLTRLSGGVRQGFRQGGSIQAAADLRELTGTHVSPDNIKSVIEILADGTRIGFHRSKESATKVLTMDINSPTEGILKIRYPEAWPNP